MTKILIVDSDNSARSYVAESLAAQRRHWTILQANAGNQALRQLTECVNGDDTAIDVVISEAELEDMNCFELLEQVRVLDETSIRLTLTANAEAEAQLGNIRASQRFLLKPACVPHLASTIDRSLRLRQSLQSSELKSFMSSVTSIPAIPDIYNRMLRELSSPNSSLFVVGEILESDSGLTLTVLKVVNSAYYGINKRVESVSQAVTLLGIHLIKNITLTTKIFTPYNGNNISASYLSQLNDEAMRIGALSNQFSRYAKLPRSTVDHCQIAGMMANVGELITAVQENETLDQDLVGASILHSWYMPDSVVEAVALQHETPTLDVDSISPHVVLHSIRYLQENFSRSSDMQQEVNCKQYLCQFIPDKLAMQWINAFKAIEQLAVANESKAA